MSKFLSLIVDDEILHQIPLPKKMNNETVIMLDEFLRQCGVLKEDEEIAVTTELN